MKLNITKEGLYINDEIYHLPLRMEVINKIFGEPKLIVHKKNKRVVWANTGLSGFVFGTKYLNQLDIKFDTKKEVKAEFAIDVKVDGVDYKQYLKIKKDDYIYVEKDHYGYQLQFQIGLDDPKEIKALTITSMPIEKLNEYLDEKDQIEIEKIPELPKPIKAEGEAMVFKDFNFKLLVIEELMYFQEKLQPKFDIYDFAKAYTKREIDIEEEGYDFIPEALEYFKELEIDSKYAADIVDLCQDGANDVYSNIIPLWDGEDDSFDIKYYDDVDLFPNLKELTLFEEDEAVYEKLREKGIDAEPI
ncbi:MAG: hypothetical protein N4A49_12035 [Marinifilaceae bacterium]|jgi:hypothetical protein|nr:hypothetical protein [Marinifilaceae bacterium]